MSASPTLAFRRRIDGICYRFAPAGARSGHPVWKRDDLDLWLIRHADEGWVVVDATGTVLSRPWNVLPSSQMDLPPEGEWVSKKGDRSYVYDLVFV
jgi:hypothetical protein